MRISKLFHWLYAFLMFLPIVLFIPNALYYGFNEHATNTETTTINYKYHSNEVNSQSDLIEGNIYHLWGDGLQIPDIIGQDGYIQFVLLNDLYFEDTQSIEFNDFDAFYLNIISKNTILKFADTDFIFFYDSLDSASEQTSYFSLQYAQGYLANDLVIQLLEYDHVSFENFAYTDFNEIDSVTINTYDTISDKMYQAWQSTWNLPLLQWTHTSFVAQPFSYITGLFGVPSDSSLNYVFAYFVSISICWLVFDLVMWLPNLAHRWLDRSSLQ